jgi:hypothetical protein
VQVPRYTLDVCYQRIEVVQPRITADGDKEQLAGKAHPQWMKQAFVVEQFGEAEGIGVVDETGSAFVVFWADCMDIYNGLPTGEVFQFENLAVRKNTPRFAGSPSKNPTLAALSTKQAPGRR